MPNWARQLFLRLTCLVVACGLILGGAWALSGGSGPQGAAQLPPPKKEATPKLDVPATEPVKATAEPKKTAPASGDSGRPLRNGKSQNLIEVDLSKLPPDLAKEVRGAIVEKGEPSRQPSGEKRRSGEQKPKEPANP